MVHMRARWENFVNTNRGLAVICLVFFAVGALAAILFIQPVDPPTWETAAVYPLPPDLPLDALVLEGPGLFDRRLPARNLTEFINETKSAYGVVHLYYDAKLANTYNKVALGLYGERLTYSHPLGDAPPLSKEANAWNITAIPMERVDAVKGKTITVPFVYRRNELLKPLLTVLAGLVTWAFLAVPLAVPFFRWRQPPEKAAPARAKGRTGH